MGEDDGAHIVRASPSNRCLDVECGPSCRCTRRGANPRPNACVLQQEHEIHEQQRYGRLGPHQVRAQKKRCQESMSSAEKSKT
eukprot:5414898-Pyramimonas_sp.AAC.1